MVYNPGQPGIDAVYETTGNLLPDDFPDTSITRNIEESYDKLQGLIKRALNVPLPTGGEGSYLARRIERKDAAKECLKAYGAEFIDKIKELDREVLLDTIDLKAILQVDVTETIEEDEIQKTGHKNWNENPDTAIPNRLKGSSTSGIEGVPRLDPDLNL